MSSWYFEQDAKRSKNMHKFLLFVLQKGAKIMQNSLCFASILHVSEKKFK
jgi:hypothetical protein